MTINFPKRPVRCFRCGELFQQLGDCAAGDFGAILSRLSQGRFSCGDCGVSFHGKCGQSSLRGAGAGFVFVICPKCGNRFRHVQPFKVDPASG